MFKKSAFVGAAAAGLMMIGGTAFASESYHHPAPEFDDEFAVVNVDDVLSNNAVNACHNNVNVLGVQVADIANGLGLSLPVLNAQPVSAADGGANCTATVVSAEQED